MNMFWWNMWNIRKNIWKSSDKTTALAIFVKGFVRAKEANLSLVHSPLWSPNVHLQILLFNTYCTLHALAFETNVLLGSAKSHIQTTFTMPHSYVEVTGSKDLGRIKPNQMFLSVEYWWKCEASGTAPASNMLDFNGDNAGVEGQEKLWTGHLCADSLSPLFYGTCHSVGKYQYELFGLNKSTDGWIIQRKNMERPRFKAGMGRNNFLAREEKEPEGCSDYS